MENIFVHSFDAEKAYLSIGGIFRAIPSLQRDLHRKNWPNPLIRTRKKWAKIVPVQNVRFRGSGLGMARNGSQGGKLPPSKKNNLGRKWKFCLCRTLEYIPRVNSKPMVWLVKRQKHSQSRLTVACPKSGPACPKCKDFNRVPLYFEQAGVRFWTGRTKILDSQRTIDFASACDAPITALSV